MVLRLSIIFICFSFWDSFSQNITVSDDEEIEIPVVFHFVSKENDKQVYSRILLNRVLEETNRRMNSIDTAKINTPFKGIAKETKIKLFISDVDTNCEETTPITYHLTPLNAYTPHIDDAYLRTKGYFKPKEFLNIWVCNLRGKNITGHTPYRKFLNGIIIDRAEFDVMIVKNNNTWTLVHELGHWLGLKHIWGSLDVHTGEIIDIDIDNCLYDDGISDTPKQKSPHLFGSVVQDSCGGINGKANHQNFMDYSYDTGMFTEDQVAVMRNYISNKRSGLLWKNNCNGEISSSVLEKSKLRKKFGTPFNFGGGLKYNTNTNLHLRDLFWYEIKIPFNNSSLDALGLNQIGTNSFKDFSTGEIVNQKKIYERINIGKAKTTYKNNFASEVPNENIDVSRINVHNTELLFSPNLKGKSTRFLKFYPYEKTLQMIKKGKLFLKTNWTSQEIEVEEFKLVYNSFKTRTVNNRPLRTPNNGEIVYKGNRLAKLIPKLHEFRLESYDAINKIAWPNTKALRTCFIYVTKIKVNNQVIDISSQRLYPISIKY